MRQLYIIILLIVFFTNGSAQKVGIGTNTPNSSARLEVASTTQGFLPPRMTLTERNAIANPATGLTVYCTTCEELQVFSEGKWKNANREAACTFGGQAVAICNQVWMTRNLDVVTYRNGDTIPQVIDPIAWGSLTTGAWCYYNNNPALGAIYGKLYNWYAVNDPRGLAPEGWHVPNDGDWYILSTCLGGDAVAGGKMKEQDTIHWQSPNTGADNSSKFAALPGGNRYPNTFYLSGQYGDVGVICWLWSASLYDAISNRAGIYRLFYNSQSIVYVYQHFSAGQSVRCVKD